MKTLDRSVKTIYYWNFQRNGLSVYVASSYRGAVRVNIGFASEKSFMNEPISFAEKAELFEDRNHNEDLIEVIENYLDGDNP